MTGTVTSEGEPLPGVSVQLKGASSGTITDIDGNYSIEVPAAGTLVFRFVGMRSVEQPVNNRSVINVTLESESKELEEVMVVAYATAKKYSFTGAASTMKAGEIETVSYTHLNRKFSYPAAFSQSTNQRRNAGTFIAGFSISKHHLDFDYTELPVFLQQTMNPGMKVKDIKYTNANISFGYAYNWVFARNCLACLSLTPAIAYKASDVDVYKRQEIMTETFAPVLSLVRIILPTMNNPCH